MMWRMWLRTVCELVPSTSSDLRVGEPAGDEFQNLPLARRQGCEPYRRRHRQQRLRLGLGRRRHGRPEVPDDLRIDHGTGFEHGHLEPFVGPGWYDAQQSGPVDLGPELEGHRLTDRGEPGANSECQCLVARLDVEPKEACRPVGLEERAHPTPELFARRKRSADRPEQSRARGIGRVDRMQAQVEEKRGTCDFDHVELRERRLDPAGGAPQRDEGGERCRLEDHEYRHAEPLGRPPESHGDIESHAEERRDREAEHKRLERDEEGGREPAVAEYREGRERGLAEGGQCRVDPAAPGHLPEPEHDRNCEGAEGGTAERATAALRFGRDRCRLLQRRAAHRRLRRARLQAPSFLRAASSGPSSQKSSTARLLAGPCS